MDMAMFTNRWQVPKQGEVLPLAQMYRQVVPPSFAWKVCFVFKWTSLLMQLHLKFNVGLNST